MDNLSEKTFTDWSLLGLRTAAWLCRHIRFNGGIPTAFFTRAARDMKMAENDRSAHELEVLLNAMELAGTVDQPNIRNLSCIELVGRRIQLIVGANSGGGAAVREGADHFMGLGRRAHGIAPVLHHQVPQRRRMFLLFSRGRGNGGRLVKAWLRQLGLLAFGRGLPSSASWRGAHPSFRSLPKLRSVGASSTAAAEGGERGMRGPQLDGRRKAARDGAPGPGVPQGRARRRGLPRVALHRGRFRGAF